MARAIGRHGSLGLLAVVIAAVLLWTACPPRAAPREYRLDASITGIQFEAAGHTLILVVQQECPACGLSMPFYQRLTEQSTPDVQVVVAAPERNVDIEGYLRRHGVNPDAIVLLGPEGAEALPVSVTPTLLLADSRGVVQHAWVGMMSRDAQEDLVNVLFGE